MSVVEVTLLIVEVKDVINENPIHGCDIDDLVVTMDRLETLRQILRRRNLISNLAPDHPTTASNTLETIKDFLKTTSPSINKEEISGGCYWKGENYCIYHWRSSVKSL